MNSSILPACAAGLLWPSLPGCAPPPCAVCPLPALALCVPDLYQDRDRESVRARARSTAVPLHPTTSPRRKRSGLRPHRPVGRSVRARRQLPLGGGRCGRLSKSASKRSRGTGGKKPLRALPRAATITPQGGHHFRKAAITSARRPCSGRAPLSPPEKRSAEATELRRQRVGPARAPSRPRYWPPRRHSQVYRGQRGGGAGSPPLAAN